MLLQGGLGLLALQLLLGRGGVDHVRALRLFAEGDHYAGGPLVAGADLIRRADVLDVVAGGQQCAVGTHQAEAAAEVEAEAATAAGERLAHGVGLRSGAADVIVVQINVTTPDGQEGGDAVGDGTQAEAEVTPVHGHVVEVQVQFTVLHAAQVESAHPDVGAEIQPQAGTTQVGIAVSQFVGEVDPAHGRLQDETQAGKAPGEGLVIRLVDLGELPGAAATEVNGQPGAEGPVGEPLVEEVRLVQPGGDDLLVGQEIAGGVEVVGRVLTLHLQGEAVQHAERDAQATGGVDVLVGAAAVQFGFLDAGAEGEEGQQGAAAEVQAHLATVALQGGVAVEQVADVVVEDTVQVAGEAEIP